MTWRYELRIEGMLKGTNISLRSHYLINDKLGVSIKGGPIHDMWRNYYKSAQVEFEFRTMSAGYKPGDFAGPECLVYVPPSSALASLDRAQRLEIAKIIQDYLLNLHEMPEEVTKRRRVTKVTFGESTKAALGL
jgi:hypothetical protein